MSGLERAEEKSSRALLEGIDVSLHAMCQPLTVLQCRLAMGEMIGEPEAMLEAIREGLKECVRLNQTVGTMRTMLQQVKADRNDECPTRAGCSIRSMAGHGMPGRRIAAGIRADRQAISIVTPVERMR